MDVNTVYHGDALDVLRGLPDGSVDAIITDPPYGTTACAWDTVVPFEPMWALFKRIAKPNAAIVMTASQPFTSALVMSNVEMFKYQWYWIKNNSTGFSHAANMPLKNVEDVVVFSAGAIGHANLIDNRMTYYPQGLQRYGAMNRRGSKGFSGTMERRSQSNVYVTEFTNYPRMTLFFDGATDTEHPTQKPVALMEYLIRTYTQPGDLVLDPFAGSGTTLVAARNLQRRYLGVELQAEYVETARKRLDKPYTLPMFD